MNILKAILKLIDRISGWTGGLAALLIVPLILVTCYEVMMRYLFNAPTSWAFELGYMLTGASFVLGCAYTLRDGAHIRIDVFYNKFPIRVRAAITFLGYLCLFLPAAWWITQGLGAYALEAFESGERSGQSAWNPPVWPFRLILSAGFGLLALQATAAMIRSFLMLISGSPPADATTEDAITADEAV